MEKIKPDFDLSDNLYYVDELGSIEEQIKFLDSLCIKSAFFHVDALFHESCELCVVFTLPGNIYSRIITLKPSRTTSCFRTNRILDLKSYLVLHKNFILQHTSFFYSPLNFDKNEI